MHARRWLKLLLAAGALIILALLSVLSNEWPRSRPAHSPTEFSLSTLFVPLTGQLSTPFVYLPILFSGSPVIQPSPTPNDPQPVPAAEAILLAAGDIADCNSPGDEATAALLAERPGTIQSLGDTVYQYGTALELLHCYDPSWGRFKDRTHPATGNHDYGSANAAPYFDYFGAAAGEIGKGYYSYDLGSWHIVVLNSNCSAVGGCNPGSTQETWFKADLAAHPKKCTLAAWHAPRFSSGLHQNNTSVSAFYQDAYDAGVDVILTGHDHDYERFAPQDPSGAADTSRGIRQFVIGTGGIALRSFAAVQPNSQARIAGEYGILQLNLHPDSYEWQFVPEAGKNQTDSGAGTCH